MNWTIPEFVKSSVWSPAGTRLALGTTRVAALGEELDEAAADLGGGQRDDPRVVGRDGGRHRPQWYSTDRVEAAARSADLPALDANVRGPADTVHVSDTKPEEAGHGRRQEM